MACGCWGASQVIEQRKKLGANIAIYGDPKTERKSFQKSRDQPYTLPIVVQMVQMVQDHPYCHPIYKLIRYIYWKILIIYFLTSI